MNRPDLRLRKCNSSRIAEKRAGMHMAQAAIGANPQISTAVFKQDAGAEVSESIPHLVADDVGLGAARHDMADTLVGSYPHASIPILHHGARKVIR